ncbi:MAG TPA: phage tail protein, partial [Nitrospira sp.]|nr:phage tail protein [Nitrospira sp.]
YLIATIRHTVNAGIKQTIHWLRTTEQCATEGELVIGPLDSRIDHCQWHRIEMQAAIPEGTSLQLATATSDTLHTEPPSDPSQKGFIQNSLAPWSIEASAGEQNPDWLVQNGPGRYLWLRITARSNGQASPVITWIKTHYPRNSYLQYLPAVYQEDEESRNFLDRFLSLFQREFDTLDRKLDNAWQLFEPGSTTDIFSDRSAEQVDQKRSVPFEQRRLQWLAGWMGLTLNPEWSEVKLREMLRKTAMAYTQRGTVNGLETTITDYSQVGFAKILEHHRIRRWPVLLGREPSSNTARPSTPLDGSMRLWSPNFYQRLQASSNSQIGTFRLTGRPEPAAEPFDWGAHTFSVFFPAHPYTREKTERAVKAAVGREKPAHTKAVLCPVFPRMRVGIQATVGVNSVVGAITHVVLGKVATLSYDTILGCSEEERNIRSLKASPRPRVGISTRFP